MILAEKEKGLLDFIGRYKSVLVAYSGGLDSAMVLWASLKALDRERVWAVTSYSESYPSGEREEAEKIADELGLPKERLLFITTKEIADPNYLRNAPDRCYFCKAELFSELMRMARELGAEVIFDGSNISDIGDYRPGRKAAEERRVLSPFVEVGLGKEELRQLARKYNLSFSEKPAAACLASRIPYGIEVTPERLRQIDDAEKGISALGFAGFRVRYHYDVARLEFRPEDIARVFDDGVRNKLVEAVKKAGFHYVALDLEGYRRGSLNRTLNAGEK